MVTGRPRPGEALPSRRGLGDKGWRPQLPGRRGQGGRLSPGRAPNPRPPRRLCWPNLRAAPLLGPGVRFPRAEDRAQTPSCFSEGRAEREESRAFLRRRPCGPGRVWLARGAAQDAAGVPVRTCGRSRPGLSAERQPRRGSGRTPAFRSNCHTRWSGQNAGSGLTWKLDSAALLLKESDPTHQAHTWGQVVQMRQH